MTATNPATEHSVLVVDDEQSIVNALRRELSTPPLGRYRYAIEGFTDPRAALERAREKEFEVVLTDFRMPEMDGLAFLKELHAIQPECARLVLSGQTDIDSLIQMINETHIYRFIPKPWSSYFLKSSVAQAVELRRVAVTNRLLARTLRKQGVDLPLDAINLVDQILVVDDDINVAHAVARDLKHRTRLDDVFSALRTETQHHRVAELDVSRISVQVTDSPAHALRMVDEMTFSCVISDYLMPGMDGGKLLEAISERQPDCALIMLSGEASMESLVLTLDLAHIHSFIAKPWVDFELRAAVAQALTRRRLELENKVLAEMCRTRDLGVVDD